ncbi:hypothetical protein HY404_00545 [Candidatus Microgenomates bacterium]|nr:hypothetical protein [Candidatus Microgenomates bacterium]
MCNIAWSGTCSVYYDEIGDPVYFCNGESNDPAAGHSSCAEECGCSPAPPPSCEEATYNECIGCNQSQTVHRHTDCSFHVHSTQEDGGCGGWCPPPPGPTCDYNREYNQCCGNKKSQHVKEYTWSDGSGVCGYDVGDCNQQDNSCGQDNYTCYECQNNTCTSYSSDNPCNTDCDNCAGRPTITCYRCTNNVCESYQTTESSCSTNCNSCGGGGGSKPAPWWQGKDADFWSNGDISSALPSGKKLIEDGTGGFPGIAVYSGNSSFGSGSVSSKGWIGKSFYKGKFFNYNWFAPLAPPAVFTDSGSIINDGEISGGNLISGYESGGYVWHYRNGDLNINSTVNLNDRKVILLVNGNLTIGGKINLNKGTGFFMAIVSGNINIDPSVSHPNQPALEGLFITNGTISTGHNPSGDDQLYVRGSLIAWAGINFQRDLDPTRQNGKNDTKPAEYIEYAPDLIFTFPRDLSRHSRLWQEVAP